MSTNIASRVNISPNVWPDIELEVQPGDMNCFVTAGVGLSGPLPLRPWDDPLRDNPSEFYGAQQHTGHPILNAPVNDPSGGTLYFDDGFSQEQIATATSMLGIRGHDRQYAAFLTTASYPEDQRFLVQLRVINFYALSHFFGINAKSDEGEFPDQPLTAGELIWAFIEDQRNVWGTGMSPQLRGAMGGDGDWAKEALCFGMFVENAWHGVFRIWSRAWLVTK